jgi:aliphatic nitrilase
VINACGALDDRMREMLAYTDDDRAFLARPELSGGSSVVGPSGDVLAGPMGPEEGILYAEAELERCVYERTVHDFAGHYNRPDVFELRVRTRPPRMVRWVEESRALDGEAAALHAPRASTDDDAETTERGLG